MTYNRAMNTKYTKTLALITSLINNNEINKTDFYNKILEEINDVINAKYLGIYFVNSKSYELKGSYPNNSKFLLNEDINKKLNSTSEITFKLKNSLNIICSKLLIRNSLFGFVIAAKDDDFTQEESKEFEAIVSIIAYLIKDYELNDVFKMQLKALQDSILEKNSAYEIIEKQHKKLLELDKTKNAFLANISHELRTPLNAIIGFSQALGCKIFGELNAKQEEYIKDIQISSLHLLGMINEILDLSKIESKAMKVSLCELSSQNVIQEVINILTPLFEQKSIKVNFINKCDKNIMADYQKLQQILYNLLSNAIKFTPENGKIEIRTSFTGKDFILEVQDNGIGIDKKYHNKIFTKFVHLNNIYTKGQSSTGLGLTITKELVKLHKGKITLESAPNEGTTFKVLLKGAIV